MFLIGGDVQHYTMIPNPSSLYTVASTPPLNEYLNIYFPGTYTLQDDGRSCDIDECSTSFHRCSYQCINMPNGYRCICPVDMKLAPDGKTCYRDYCLEVDCSYGCVSRNNTFNCFCPQGQQLASDQIQCEDYDECKIDNGDCSHICVNKSPNRECRCPDDLVLSADGQTCEEDRCLQHACDHYCISESAQCGCHAGFILSEDGRTCEQFSRCHLDNGNCEFKCVSDANFSYHCECPAGMSLRADGNTCGVSCYSCSWAATESECNQQGTITCPVGENSCGVEVRTINAISYISKGCKQAQACISNYYQNAAPIAPNTTQCNDGPNNSICHYCCFDNLCNAGYDWGGIIYHQVPGCMIEDHIGRDEYFIYGEQSVSTVQIGGSLRRQCPAGTNHAGNQQITCDWQYNQMNGLVTSFWSGELSDDAMCTDVDECSMHSHSCSQHCQNRYGGYKCYCDLDQAASCNSAVVDLLFIIDSSVSLNTGRFQYFQDFIKNMLMPIEIGADAARVAIATFGDKVDIVYRFEDAQVKTNIMNTIRALPCCNGKPYIGDGIESVVTGLLSSRTSSNPLYSFVITDSLSYDDVNLSGSALRQASTLVYAVGTFEANYDELRTIAGTKDRAIFVPDYTDLNSVLFDELRTPFCHDSHSSTYSLVGNLCEKDECATNNGGCDQRCINTLGSFYCQCDGAMVLADDQRTCVQNYCANSQLKCAHGCTNTISGGVCSCPEQFTIADDNQTCIDLNECDLNNGGCDGVCVNLSPGYQCACPGALVAQDKHRCIPDPCQHNHCDNDEVCRPNYDGSYQCSCRDGYAKNSLNICDDIDECQISNWCQHGCINTDGGFECQCPNDRVLRDDRRTCGIVCYKCDMATTNEECNTQSEVCSSEIDSCENEIRVHHGIKHIFKRCKQAHACYNNYIQNPPSFLLQKTDAKVTEQCNSGIENSVCRCCCQGSHCNWAEKPCVEHADCMQKYPLDITILLDSSSATKYENFEKMKLFTARILNSFDYSSGRVQAALIKFHSTTEAVFTIGELENKQEILDSINSSVYNGTSEGSTDTAVQFIKDELSTPSRLVEKVYIIVTNSNGTESINVAGVNVYTVSFDQGRCVQILPYSTT